MCALAGGNCTDGGAISPLVQGSTWQISGGIWALSGCPAGYYLATVCQLCPAFFYCTGGNLPSTPCASSQYSQPGATSEAACFAAVFVIVIINVPITRVDFVGGTELRFQGALAHAAGLSPDYVYLDIIQAGSDPATTSVTSKIATKDAKEASALFQGLDSGTVRAAYTLMGLGSPTLISVQETACVPGYALDSSSQVCLPCPPNYYCLGGSDGSRSCPAGTFAVSGANSSSACIPVVFVVVSAKLSMPQHHFTSRLQSKFQAAMAVTAGVMSERVVLEPLAGSRRSADLSPEVLVNSEIAADNAAAAQSIGQRVDLTSLNSNLVLQGLPMCTALSVTVAGAATPSSSGAVSLPAVLGGSVSGAVLVVAAIVSGYFLRKRVERYRALRAFLAAMRGAKEGQPCSTKHLPPDADKKSLSLRMQYTAEMVLGKGANCSVVLKAKKGHIGGKRPSDVQTRSAVVVALKITVPKEKTFTLEEKKKLQREAELLALVTAKQCKSAVHRVAADSDLMEIPQQPYACWFIMEALGSSAATMKPIGDAACVQLARDVLAALKVFHNAKWLHGDVNSTNVVRCDSLSNEYEYKLIDFGSAMQIGESTSSQVATGAAAYRAPEMFGKDCVVTKAADVWSLGVTMFELLAGRLPFLAEGGGSTDAQWAASIAGDMSSRAPNVNECLQCQSMDMNLAKVISRALEKNRTTRQVLIFGVLFYGCHRDGLGQ